jgi:hypothetical protein
MHRPNYRQTYHCCCQCQCCRCILHCRCRCFNLSPVQAPSLVALPLLCAVVSLLCLLILVIPLYFSTNNMSWINYYYPDNVNTTDTLIGPLQMILVCFDFHTVDGINAAMHLAQTLLKLEDCASTWLQEANLQSGWMQESECCAWTLQKTRSPSLLQCHQLYKERIQA